MENKEKQEAERIYNDYYKINNDNQDVFKIRQKEVAKKNAIKCVEEILKAVTTIADKKYDYWQQVKQELEKL